MAASASGTSAAQTDVGRSVADSDSLEHAWLCALTDNLLKDPLPQQPFFSVPRSLRTPINADAYLPILFQFGFLHAAPHSFLHDSSSSAFLFKLHAVKMFRNLGAKQSEPDAFRCLANKLMEFDKTARDCYGLQLSEKKLSTMAEAYATAIALDAVTIYIAAKKANEVQFHPPFWRTNPKVLAHKSEGVKLAPLIKLYGCRNSPFPVEGWCDIEPVSGGNNDLKSLLGCIYDGWVMSEAKGAPRMANSSQEDSTSRSAHTSIEMAERQNQSQVAHSTSFPDGLEEDKEPAEGEPLLDGDPETPGDSKSTHYNEQAAGHGKPRARGRRSSSLLSAAHLYRRGIRFTAHDYNSIAPPNTRTSSRWNLATCITFDDKSGTLSLPKITVLHGTRRFLLNLLAYEHTSRFSDACTLLSFVCFLDMLINNEQDVELLVECGVVINELGSHKQLAAMWNGLTDGYPFRLSEGHQELVRRIRAESQRRLRRWRHAFRDSYYERRPWLLLSALAAVLLLAFSLLQTIYTMLGFYQKKH